MSLKDFRINPDYLSSLSEKRQELENNSPFPHLQLPDFLVDDEVTSTLRKELEKIKWKRRENDLLSLSQTDDLAVFNKKTTPNLQEFRRFFKSKVLNYLKELTGLDLNENVAITGSKYGKTATLLPHDDSLEERAIAFVYYLSPEWKEEYGGALALYNADESTNRPSEVVKRLLPQNNTLVIFPVNTNTWHHVEEVVGDESRLSLNGWFHVTSKKSAEKPTKEPKLEREVPSMEITLEDVKIWFNPQFVTDCDHGAIQKRFGRQSQLSFDNFLNEDCFDQVLAELKISNWDLTGPPDRRRLERLNESSLNPKGATKTLLNLFRSEAMTLFASQWTGLKLLTNPIEPDVDEGPAEKRRKTEDSVDGISFTISLNRYKHGSYSMTDSQIADETKHDGYCLDLMLFLSESESWKEEAGGFVSYIAENDPNEVLRVPPRSNSLNVVFREPTSFFFTKFVNCLAGQDEYYVLNLSYYGVQCGENDSEEGSDEDLENDDEMDPEDYDVGEEFENDESNDSDAPGPSSSK